MSTNLIFATRTHINREIHANNHSAYKRMTALLKSGEALAALYCDDDRIAQTKIEVIALAKRKLGAKVEPVKATAPASSQAVVRKEIVVYTDGACSGNPGPGGWAAILTLPETGYTREFTGNADSTTNNRMELMAAIGGLSAIKNPANVTLYSDSAYLVNAFEKNWIEGWIAKNWLNSKKQPVENRDLWKQLIELAKQHNVKFVKVAGHAGNKMNERCDKLAKEACQEAKEAAEYGDESEEALAYAEAFRPSMTKRPYGYADYDEGGVR